LTPRRLRGSRAKGKAYERKLARFVSRLHPCTYNPWIYFVDANGPGWAQPDIIVHCLDRTVVLEAKLSETAAALPQLHDLYGPLVQRLYGKPVLLVQVFRFPRQRGLALSSFTEVLLADPGYHRWHWLGL